VRVFTAPDAPSGVTASEGDTDATVSFTPGSTNGARADEVQYQVKVNGGGWQAIAAGGGVVGGLGNNGGPYSFVVRAVTTVDGQQHASASSSASDAVRPYGAIGAPSASGSGQVEQVTFSWSAPARNGRDISTRIRIDNGGWRSVGNSGTQSVSASGGQTVRITVESTTGLPDGARHGVQTTTASADATAEARRNPSVALRRGDDASSADGGCYTGTAKACRYYELVWTDLAPGTYDFTCHNTASNGGASFQSGQVRIDSANGSTQNRVGGGRMCYSGYPGDAWMRITGGPDDVDLTTPRVPWP
jgi:hypothetical protein